jgi:hypothetical protein
MGNLDFNSKDVIVVTDQVQVDWLSREFGPDLRDAEIYPISLQAHSAALRLGIGRTRHTFGNSDFCACDQKARAEMFRFSQHWLQELGLNFSVADVDVAPLDASCQFLLFIHCVYVQSAALNLLCSVPDDCRINVVSPVHPLPLDFYFDSDVSSAVLRNVLETHGREPRLVRMERRDQYLFHKARPLVVSEKSETSKEVSQLVKSPGGRRWGRYRVGIVPATIAKSEGYFDALRQLDCEVHSFVSAWSPQSEQSGIAACHCISADDGVWSESVAARLRALHEQVSMRIEQSSLPAYIIANPYLEFQWDYIFNQRWLAYANMIMRVQAFAESQPLDLFIHCDHFTTEAAILANFYRRKKTRVLVAPHSGWPVDADWSLNHPSDFAVVASRSAVKRLAAISGMSKILVAGRELVRPYESLRHAAQFPKIVASRIRGPIGDRKLVLVMTNALELNAVPFTALASHFATLSKLAEPPNELRQGVFVAVRRKPGIFGDSAEMLQELCGFSREAVSLTDGLTFVEAVRLADCVVGVNVGTSGYFEILEENCPLLHIQTAEVAALHPDLPAIAVPRITREEDIWPAIESLLFDSTRREQVKRTQAAFVLQDRRTQFDGVESVIKHIRRFDLGWRVRSLLAKARHRGSEAASSANVTLSPETSLPTAEQPCAGYVDDVLSGSDTNYVLLGWAADLQSEAPAGRVHAFLNGSRLACCAPSLARPDVADAHGNSNFTYTGFRLPVRVSHREQLASVSVYAEMQNKQLLRLHDAALRVEEAR